MLSDSEIGTIHPRVRWDIEHTDPSHPKSVGQWSWGFRTLQSVIDPGDARFRPRVVGVVDVYGTISGSEMERYRPRVRRDLDIGPRDVPRVCLRGNVKVSPHPETTVGGSHARIRNTSSIHLKLQQSGDEHGYPP